MYVTIMHGDMLNIQENEWSQVFAQAIFACVESDILKVDLPFTSLLILIKRKLIGCFSISIPKTDPLFKKENFLQILKKKNAKVEDILGNYSLTQLMDIFDQSSQFKDCYWINEVKLILKNFCWMKFGFKISNYLSLFIPVHFSFPSHL